MLKAILLASATLKDLVLDQLRSLFYPSIMIDRHISFDGTFNTRDLGGLRTKTNGTTRFHSIVRSDSIDEFSHEDWNRLSKYGTRTLIDLRNENEIRLRQWPRGFERIQISLDGEDDPEFWAEWRDTGKWCTPLYYKAHLNRFPHLTARVVRAIARASGGVLVHCGAGRDRTGLISLVLLQLAGVTVAEIAADHAMSHNNLAKLYRTRGLRDESEFIKQKMQESGRTILDIVEEISEKVSLKPLLLSNGCTQSDFSAIETRLIGQVSDRRGAV